VATINSTNAIIKEWTELMITVISSGSGGIIKKINHILLEKNIVVGLSLTDLQNIVLSIQAGEWK
jgi:hypothetical protein